MSFDETELRAGDTQEPFSFLFSFSMHDFRGQVSWNERAWDDLATATANTVRYYG